MKITDINNNDLNGILKITDIENFFNIYID